MQIHENQRKSMKINENQWIFNILADFRCAVRLYVTYMSMQNMFRLAYVRDLEALIMSAAKNINIIPVVSGLWRDENPKNHEKSGISVKALISASRFEC